MDENPHAKLYVKKWILTLVGSLLSYVLSWGVVFAMYGTGRFTGPVPGWVTGFYTPVKWLLDHTALETPLVEYLFWCARVLTPYS